MENNIDYTLDKKLNKTVIDIFSYSFAGYLFGIAVCPLFKNKMYNNK